MATLYEENRLESELDNKIKTILRNEFTKKRTYRAVVTKRDSSGTWWARIDGNESDTPIMVTTIDMSVGDVISVTIDNHVSLADGNITAPPWSSANAKVYVDELVARSITAAEARFGYLEADYAYLKYAQIDYADITEARIQELTVESTRRYNYLEADTAKIHDLTADTIHATTGYIQDLVAENITTDNLIANVGKIDSLTGEELSYTVGYIADLTSENITTQTLVATTGYIGTLTSNSITTQKLQATTGYIDQLTAHSITANDIYSDHATIASLDSTYAQISVLESDYATIAELHSDYAEIDLANVNNAWIQNGTIKDAAIGDAQIIGVSANKLTAGRIDAANINVVNLRTSNLIVDKINGQPVFGDYSFVKPTSAGYSSKNPQTEGWYELVNGQFILSTDTSVQDGKTYYAEGNYVALYDQDYIDSLETRLDQRIDGAVETFTVDAVPTLLNSPANGWAVSEYQSHVGDVAYVVNAASSSNGYCYRFAYDNTSQQYMWVLIKDSDVTKALQDLIDVQGDISGLQTFQTETISWQEDTDEEMTSVKGRVSTVETNLGTKVSTTVFNELSQTVDENSATITSMSETVQRGGVNLLRNTGAMESIDGYCNWAVPGGDDGAVENGVAYIPGDGSWRSIGNASNIVLSDVVGVDMTFSVDIRAQESGADFIPRLELGANPTQNQSDRGGRKYAVLNLGEEAPTTSWKRFSLTFKITDVNWFDAEDSGSGQVAPSLTDYLRLHVHNHSDILYEARHLKLEYGTYATPWETSPEDTYTFSNTVNEVKQTADTNSASIRQVTTTVQNLDGGGRNLLYLTRDFAAKEGATTGGYLSATSAAIANETYKGLKVRTLDYTSTATSSYTSVASYQSVLVPKMDKTYCLGFYAKGSGTIMAFFYHTGNDGGVSGVNCKAVTSQGSESTAADGYVDFTLSNTWTRYWVKWTPGGAQATIERHVLIRIYGGNSVSVCGLMFEEAAIPSNWTPAPEDLDGDIVTLITKTSEITQTLDGVKTVIGYSEDQQGVASSTLVTKVNTIDETVDGHTQSIESVTTTLTEGGRNLLRNSGTFDGWTKSGATFADGEASASASGKTSNVNYLVRQWVGTGVLADYMDETFSISFEVYSDDWSAVEEGSNTGLGGVAIQLSTFTGAPYGDSYGDSGRYFFARLSNSTYFNAVTPENGKWIRVTSKPITVSSSLFNNSTSLVDGYNSLVFYFILVRRNGSVKMRHPQIELGSIVTPWNSSPYDIQTVDRKYAEYVMTNEEFKTTVGETYSTKAELSEMARNVLVNTANPTISTAQWSPSGYATTPDNLWRSYSTNGGTISKTTDGVKITFTGNGTTGLTVPFIAKNALKAGETVTLSYMYRGTITNAGTPYILNATGNNSSQTAQTGTTGALTGDGEWHVAHKTYTVVRTSADALSFLVFYVNPSANSWLEIKDGTLMLERGDIATRVTTAETQIEQNKDAITLRATKTEAYQMSQPNLSPFFSNQPIDATSNTFWTATAIVSGCSVTDKKDGWIRIQYNNTTGSTVRAFEVCPALCPSVEPGADYTWLMEFRNNVSTASSNDTDFYLVQNNNNQFWGATGKKSLDDISSNPNNAKLAHNLRRIVKTSETAANGHWSGSEPTRGLAQWVMRVASGDTVDCEFRLSLYEGEYTGPYKPYAGAQLYASQAELKITSDGITSTVSKIGSVKYVTTSYSRDLATLKSWAAEGHSDNWNIAADNTIRVGDTVYVKCTDTTRSCPVFIKVTVTAVNSSTSISGVSHGYEDVIPVDTVKSTINQSPDSVKIKANHIEIDGTTVFRSSSSSTTTFANYVSGVADAAVDDIEVSARNLVRNGNFAEGTSYWTTDGSSATTTTDSTYGNILTVATSSGNYRVYPSSFDHTTGQTYSLSFYAKASAATTLYVDRGNSRTAANLYGTYSLTTSWQRFEGTLVAGSTGSLTFQLQEAQTFYLANVMLVRGDKAMDYEPDPRDVVLKTQRVYYRSKVSGTVSAPTTWITATGNIYNDTVSVGNGGWTTKITPVASSVGTDANPAQKYLYLYTCTQTQRGDGKLTSSSVLLDDTTTIIDGGTIVTGSVTANKLNASNINASNILTVGSMSTATQNIMLDGARNLALRTTVPMTCSRSGSNSYMAPSPLYPLSDYAKDLLTDTNNTTFTVSFDWVSTNVTTAFTMSCALSYSSTSFQEGTLVSRSGASVPTGSSSGHYVRTFTPTTGHRTYGYRGWLLGGMSTSGTESGQITVSNFQFELGNADTPWAVAPEDSVSSTEVTTAVDFNTLMTTGFYYIRISTCANIPIAAHGLLEVNFTVGTPYQIYQPDSTTTAYYKRKYSSADGWSSWTTIDGKGAYDLASTANNRASAYRGTLGTDGSTAAKVVTCAGFSLATGATVSVYCSSSGHNVSGAMTLNVNSTGAKNIWVAGAVTSDTNRLYWTYGATLTFTYDGSVWRLTDSPPAMYGKGYESGAVKETCETAEGTADKNVMVDSFVCFRGATLSVPMKYSNTSTSAAICLKNSSGTSTPALTIYHGASTNVPTRINGSSGNGLAWPAGETVIFTFDGKFWRTGNQTFINGGNITTGTVAADRIAVSDIQIGDLNGQLGGTNMLPDSNASSFTKVVGAADRYLSDSGQSSYVTGAFSTISDPPAPGITNGYKLTCSTAASSRSQRGYAWNNIDTDPSIRIIPGETYTMSCYVRKVSGTPYVNQRFSHSTDGTNWVYTSSSWQNVTWTTWKRISYTFTYPAATVKRGPLYVAQIATNSVGVLEACGFKMELGNRATDWSPAPAEVSSVLTHISKDGIRIHPASTSDYRVDVKSDGTYIYKAGYLKAKYLDTITLYGGSNASGANPSVSISSSQVLMKDSGGSQRLLLDSSTGVQIGRSDKQHININDTNVDIYNNANTPTLSARLNADGLTMYRAGSKRAATTADGLDIFGSDGSTSIASFGSTARIGKSSAPHVEIGTASIHFYKNASTKFFSISNLSNAAMLDFNQSYGGYSYFSGGVTDDQSKIVSIVAQSASGYTASVNGTTTSTSSTLSLTSGNSGASSTIALKSSGAIAINGTETSGIYTKSATGHLDWSTHSDKLITNATLAYWNGRYNSGSSNLAYCNKGAFNTLATKSSVSISTSDQTGTSSSATSVAANGSASISVTVTVPDGYVFGGIFELTTDQTASCGIVGYVYNSGTLACRVRNFTSAAKSTKVTAKIRFIKATVS